MRTTPQKKIKPAWESIPKKPWRPYRRRTYEKNWSWEIFKWLFVIIVIIAAVRECAF